MERKEYSRRDYTRQERWIYDEAETARHIIAEIGKNHQDRIFDYLYGCIELAYRKGYRDGAAGKPRAYAEKPLLEWSSAIEWPRECAER